MIFFFKGKQITRAPGGPSDPSESFCTSKSLLGSLTASLTTPASAIDHTTATGLLGNSDFPKVRLLP